MSIDTFGYNGVLEMSEDVVNRVLAEQAYERFLVEKNKQVVDGDFIGPIEITIDQSTSVRLYLLTGKPSVTFQNHDGSDGVALTVPFLAIGLYLVSGGTTTPVNLGAQLLAITVDGVTLGKNDSTLSVDFSKVTKDSISISAISVKPGPTDVGGTVTSTVLLNDAAIDAILQQHGVALSAAKIRQEVAKQLKSGAFSSAAQLPVMAGGIESALQSWDFFLFDGTNAGADLLLFDAGGSGQGFRADTTDNIPASTIPPNYGFGVSVKSEVLLADIETILSTQDYFQQGGTLNTPTNPLGYLVVPASGARSYTLPRGGTIAVSAAVNGQVTVTIAAGVLSPHARARLKNLDQVSESRFEADGSGAATKSVTGHAGERLALIIDAVSTPADSSVVIWRPTIEFQDGSLKINFHFYKYNATPGCDAEGDGWIVLALSVDRSVPFGIKATLVDSAFSLPWWVAVVSYFVADFGEQILSWLVRLLIAEVIEQYVKGSATSKIQSGLGPILAQLNAKLTAPSLKDAAVFLDDINLSRDGIELSGYADAGEILAYGRNIAFSTSKGTVLNSGGVYVGFDWSPAIGGIQITGVGPSAAITDNARVQFWSATYDDLPASFGQNPITLAAGQTAMLWVAIDGGHAKVLFERPPDGDAPSTGILVTWIALRDRVGRLAKIVNSVKATLQAEVSSLLLDLKTYSYYGTVGLKTEKFFLTDDTVAAGQEHWFWDDQEVTAWPNPLLQPGGTITLDPGNHNIIVDLNQSVLIASMDIPSTHQVRFEGTDVFGRKFTANAVIPTPARTLTPIPIGPIRPIDRIPVGDPARDFPIERLDPATLRAIVQGALAAQGVPQAESVAVAGALSDAITTGSGQLDGFGAATLVGLIGRSARGG